MSNVVIYSRPLCGYCTLAKALFDRKGVSYEEVDVAADRSRIAEMIGRSGGRLTFPQVFVNGRHVGGYDDVAALDRRGMLDQLLKAA